MSPESQSVWGTEATDIVAMTQQKNRLWLGSMVFWYLMKLGLQDGVLATVALMLLVSFQWYKPGDEETCAGVETDFH